MKALEIRLAEIGFKFDKKPTKGMVEKLYEAKMCMDLNKKDLVLMSDICSYADRQLSKKSAQRETLGTVIHKMKNLESVIAEQGGTLERVEVMS